MSPKPPYFLGTPAKSSGPNKRKGKKMVFSLGVVFFPRGQSSNFRSRLKGCRNHLVQATKYLDLPNPWRRSPLGLAYENTSFPLNPVWRKKGGSLRWSVRIPKKQQWTRVFSLSLMWLKSKVVVSKPFWKTLLKLDHLPFGWKHKKRLKFHHLPVPPRKWTAGNPKIGGL